MLIYAFVKFLDELRVINCLGCHPRECLGLFSKSQSINTYDHFCVIERLQYLKDNLFVHKLMYVGPIRQ